MEIYKNYSTILVFTPNQQYDWSNGNKKRESTEADAGDENPLVARLSLFTGSALTGPDVPNIANRSSVAGTNAPCYDHSSSASKNRSEKAELSEYSFIWIRSWSDGDFSRYNASKWALGRPWSWQTSQRLFSTGGNVTYGNGAPLLCQTCINTLIHKEMRLVSQASFWKFLSWSS